MKEVTKEELDTRRCKAYEYFSFDASVKMPPKSSRKVKVKIKSVIQNGIPKFPIIEANL